MLLDIVMPRLDGFSTLEALGRTDAGRRPKVIMLTGLTRDDFIVRAMNLGADYYMIKPFDMQMLYARIREVAQSDSVSAYQGEIALTQTAADATVDEKVTNIFLSIGIPAHIKGYQYLREAVLMVLENRDIINRITKELYPGIARRFNTSASKVERAMRHAIEVAWSRGRLDTVNRMYGYKVFDAMDKPTNGEYISCVSELIKRSRNAG